ncbi:MAG: hypothetical protein ABIE74_09975 [Pseudomonadota bacterium]
MNIISNTRNIAGNFFKQLSCKRIVCDVPHTSFHAARETITQINSGDTEFAKDFLLSAITKMGFHVSGAPVFRSPYEYEEYKVYYIEVLTDSELPYEIYYEILDRFYMLNFKTIPQIHKEDLDSVKKIIHEELANKTEKVIVKHQNLDLATKHLEYLISHTKFDKALVWSKIIHNSIEKWELSTPDKIDYLDFLYMDFSIHTALGNYIECQKVIKNFFKFLQTISSIQEVQQHDFKGTIASMLLSFFKEKIKDDLLDDKDEQHIISSYRDRRGITRAIEYLEEVSCHINEQKIMISLEPEKSEMDFFAGDNAEYVIMNLIAIARQENSQQSDKHIN